jgi:hypothetical protein
LNVANEPLVGHSSERPDDSRGVVRGGSRRFPAVEVRADGQIAMRREFPGDLLHSLVVAGHVVDHHNAAKMSLIERLGEVSLDLVASVAREADGLRPQRVRHVRAFLPLCRQLKIWLIVSLGRGTRPRNQQNS